MGCGATKVSIIEPTIPNEKNEILLDPKKQYSPKRWLGADDTITDRANFSGDFGDDDGNLSNNSQNTSQSELQNNIQISSPQRDNKYSTTMENQENSNFLSRSISPEVPFTFCSTVENIDYHKSGTDQKNLLPGKEQSNEKENLSDSVNSIRRIRSPSFHIFSSRRIIRRFTPEQPIMLSDNETNEIEISSSLMESNPLFGIRGTGDNNFDVSSLSLN